MAEVRVAPLDALDEIAADNHLTVADLRTAHSVAAMFRGPVNTDHARAEILTSAARLALCNPSRAYTFTRTALAQSVAIGLSDADWHTLTELAG